MGDVIEFKPNNDNAKIPHRYDPWESMCSLLMTLQHRLHIVENADSDVIGFRKEEYIKNNQEYIDQIEEVLEWMEEV